MDTTELTYLATLAEKATTILEIGTWMGRSCRAFADNTLGTVTCVDTWADDAYGDAPAEITCHKNWLFNQFCNNLNDHLATGKVIPIRLPSAHAPLILTEKMFDLIFIDAGHNYEDVKADILNYRPLLAEGGILCGHDMYPDGPYHPGVLQAVTEFVGNYALHGTIWTAK